MILLNLVMNASLEDVYDSEPNCGVKKAVEDGKISKERYEHYLMNLQDVKKKEERKYG